MTRRLNEETERTTLEDDRSALLTACGRLLGSVGLLIIIVLLPATFLVTAGSLGLIDRPGWAGDNTTAFGFFLIVVPVGLALATVHFFLGALVLARRLWPVVATILLLLAVVTLFPLGLRVSWPFLGLTILYTASLILVVARHHEFE
jgi:uncharacterized membrane protein